ncbi:hypothetical protein LCGC14_2313240 [marine sediment metagenome]|uniref:Uncharacterized protein n=1 Tax=marine sediment metagenome TaxID=412755 RepID=A0A0F9EXE8_9ZZZZ
MPSLLITGLIVMVLFGGSLYIFIRLVMKESKKFSEKGKSGHIKQLNKLRTH